MSYSSGEGNILATLRLHANYDSTNTRRANWQVLSGGNKAYYVILRPGAFTMVDTSLGGGLGAAAKRQANWTTELMVYQRYVDDGSSATNLQARVDEIIAHLDKYRQAGDSGTTIQMARITGGGPVEEVQMGSASGPLFLRQILTVAWDEERSVTYAE